MEPRKFGFLLVGAVAGTLAWVAGLGGPLPLLVGLGVTAVLLVTLTGPAGRSTGAAADSNRDDTFGWGSPATDMLLWSGVLFGWANGTGGGGDQFDAGGGFEGGGSDAGGGFDGGGGGSE